MGSARNRWLALGALALAASALAFIAFGNLGENLVYYWSPSEMLAQKDKAYGATIRLGGVVAKGSLQWEPEKTLLHFKVAENAQPGAVAVPVVATQVPPQMFREGIGVVVEGTLTKALEFQSDRLMVNHSNEYRPPKDGEALRNYGAKSLSSSSAP